MSREITYESLLEDMDRILESALGDLPKAGSRLCRLDQDFERLLNAAKIDEPRRRALSKALAPMRASAAQLTKSLSHAKRGGLLREDWLRLAQRDFTVLKDDLLAVREHLVEAADFVRFACLREQLGELAGTDPSKIFEELHGAEAISERTWLLLMTQPGSWQEALKDGEISKQLAHISSWLLDLQDARRRAGRGTAKTTGDDREHIQEKE